jgi:hypothetical protein
MADFRLGSLFVCHYFHVGFKMKSIAVKGSTVGIAGAVLVAAVGISWTIARATTRSNVRSLQEQITVCGERAAATLAESARATNAALAAKTREITRVQELKSENEQLRQANEKQERELASAEADESRGGGALHPWPEPSAPPVQTFELSPGEQRDIIPGVLDLMVETLDPAAAQVWYGGYPRHLKVGQSVAISYLGRRCLLGLTEIKGGGDTQKGSFSFTVVKPQRWGDEAAAPGTGPSE